MLNSSREHVPVGFGLAARILLISAAAAAVALVVWLGWTGKQMRDEAQLAAQRDVRVAELRGTIATLDLCLSMSARMAVASGQRRWADNYEEAAPKLDAALAEAASLASPEVRTAFANTAGEGHRNLTLMERRAMALAASGDLPAARALLDGPDFAYNQDVYRTGIEVFGQDLASQTKARTSDLEHRAWLGAAGTSVAAVLLIGLSLWLRSRTRLKAALARAAIVARTDALTGLPNRRRFNEDFQAVLEHPEAASATLLLVDLDRFKAVNDAHGPAIGDEILQVVANRLRGQIRATDLISRLGVDEFAVVCSIEAVNPASAQDAAAVAQRILATLSEPIVLAQGTIVQIGASIGGAVPDEGCRSASGLLHRAGVAVRQAKVDGRGRFRRFQAGMDAEMRARARLEGDLRHAIASDAIMPHYQPLVDLGTGDVVGVEMLARWTHAERGVISPAEFIPLAEETGLIGAMTAQLLRRACREAADWPGHIRLACNVSALQLRDPGLPDAIRAILAETGFPADRLEIEITESALVGDLDFARALLNQLHRSAIRLALDDFGTGYSSLRHLQALPFDKIKIDRSFVAGLGSDAESGKIVAAVVSLGHSLDLEVVAEGVETEQVADALRALGCDLGQGWLFGRPGPAERIVALLEGSREPCEAAA